VVVLTLENEEDDSLTWTEYSRRVGCGPTILSMLYDQVLEEPLLVRSAGGQAGRGRRRTGSCAL
jgi:hypothetical protein